MLYYIFDSSTLIFNIIQRLIMHKYFSIFYKYFPLGD